MFFLASKLLWMATAPVTLMLALELVGVVLLWRGRVRAGRRFVLVGAGAMVICGVLPLGTLMLRPLENRFPPLSPTLPPPTGIIVLGGSSDQALSAARGRVTIVEAADRLTEAVILARRFPAARIVFTGGSNALSGITVTEAADARHLWVAMGVADDRITTEDRSRNTDENVRFSKRLVEPEPGETWVLVTSAYHMPRAVGLFRANDWPVIPDPVDYRTFGTPADWRLNTDPTAGLARFSMALREWIGLVAYALSGRTQAILPQP
jgi:uncharacterized SAM-binding protein YcdF (DUF218 family)